MRASRHIFALLALATCASLLAQAASARKIAGGRETIRIDRSALFDTPLAEVVVAVPPPKLNPQNHAYLACFFYPGFVVKELDLGDKGAERLSIAPVPSRASTPPCAITALPGEQVVRNRSGDDWSGYFKGVKGGFALFDDSDSFNGGLGFGVVDVRSGATVFVDSAALTGGFSRIASDGATLTLDYRRALSPGCSLMTQADACWRKVLDASGLAEASRPHCAGAYARLYPAGASGGDRTKQIKAINDVPSVITYNVRATIGKKLESLKPRPGSVACSVSD